MHPSKTIAGAQHFIANKIITYKKPGFLLRMVTNKKRTGGCV